MAVFLYHATVSLLYSITYQKHLALVRIEHNFVSIVLSDVFCQSYVYNIFSDYGIQDFVNILCFTGYGGAAGVPNGKLAKAANSGKCMHVFGFSFIFVVTHLLLHV